MFFKAHEEHKIGYKRLSDADLGLGTSHQTHIGLYQDVLKFLPNVGNVSPTMLIYENYCDIIDCCFDRIQNHDGSYRSPKIKKGTEGSLVNKIHEFAQKDPHVEWFLLWFGIDSNELVFILLNSTSADYATLAPYLADSPRLISHQTPAFNAILKFIEEKVDMVSIDLQEELEIIAQTNDTLRKFKPFDVEKAERRFKAIGRRGEELIYGYLDKEKFDGRISSFLWLNKDRESGLTYDFIVNANSPQALHIDVKSTQFKFEQQVVFSSNEIDFVARPENYTGYQIYRVFDMNAEQAKLRICSDVAKYAVDVHERQQGFIQGIKKLSTRVDSIKYAVSPKLFTLSNVISL